MFSSVNQAQLTLNQRICEDCSFIGLLSEINFPTLDDAQLKSILLSITGGRPYGEYNSTNFILSKLLRNSFSSSSFNSYESVRVAFNSLVDVVEATMKVGKDEINRLDIVEIEAYRKIIASPEIESNTEEKLNSGIFRIGSSSIKCAFLCKLLQSTPLVRLALAMKNLNTTFLAMLVVDFQNNHNHPFILNTEDPIYRSFISILTSSTQDLNLSNCSNNERAAIKFILENNIQCWNIPHHQLIASNKVISDFEYLQEILDKKLQG